MTRRISWLVALAVAVGVLSSSTGAQADAPLPVLAPGRMAQLSDPGVELVAPIDGRLRGAGVALLVTGGALTNRAGHGSDAVSAGPGRHLIVFGIRPVALPDGEAASAPPSLALVVAGDRQVIDLSALASSGGPAFFAASIPASATDVGLELSSLGFSQRFSLLALSRPVPDPVALYRDSESPEVVSDVGIQKAVVATVPADGFTAGLVIEVKRLTLSWFSPGPSAEVAPDANGAFLSVEADVTPEDGTHYIGSFAGPLPAEHLHLVLPDGSTVTGVHSGASDGLLAGTYSFAVPANLTTATLRADPVTVQGAENVVYTFDTVPVSLPGYDIPVTLPPPVAARAAATTPTTFLHLTGPAPGPSAPATGHHGGGVSGWWLVLLVPVAAAGGGVALSRRRRRAPVPAMEVPAGAKPGDTPVPTTHAAMATSAPAAPAPTPCHSLPDEPVSRGPGPSVLVLGPVDVSALNTAGLRPADVELAVYLALHADRPVTGDKLRDALGVSGETVRTYASRVRQAVGADRLPPATDGKYQMRGVGTDWDRFQELIDDAARAGDPRGSINFSVTPWPSCGERPSPVPTTTGLRESC